LVETATKCLATRLIAQLADSSPGGGGVGDGLQRGEGLEEMMNSVSSADRSGRLDEVGGVDVGDEPERDVAGE